MGLQNCFLSSKLHSYFMVSAFQCCTLNTQQNDTRFDIPRYQHSYGQGQTAHSEQVGLPAMMCRCLFKPFSHPRMVLLAPRPIPYLPLVIPFQHLSSDTELAITFLLHRLLGRVTQYVLRAVRFPLASKTCKQRGCSGP